MSAEHPVEQPIRGIDLPNGPSGLLRNYTVGRYGVTRIEACTKPGVHCDIPYVRVWHGETCAAEFCQHHIVGVYFDPF